MGSAGSADRYLPPDVQHPVKFLVAGAFGVGKTTMIGSVSEIVPLRTEETMSMASEGVDDLAGLAAKTTTTVAMDFGRITLSPRIVAYLFGMPGQRRFWGMWEGLSDGALGVLVLVDTRRLESSFEVLDMLELRNEALPVTVAVNHFPGSQRHHPEVVAAALDLLPGTPVVECDARDRTSSLTALSALAEHALATAGGVR